MLEFKTGNILAEDADALVNTVNCVGVMGRGIALQFKKAFPENYKAYAAACQRDELRPGRMFVFETRELANPRLIINFPTKRHWRGKSRMQDIEDGLKALRKTIRESDIHSVAIPPLGCGLGGLNWNEVRPRIEEALCGLGELHIVVFEPSDVAETTEIGRSQDIPEMTAGRAALVGLTDTYLNGLLDPFITLLEIHKLMYFLQDSGEPLKLRFTKATFGPYAENLRHVLNQIDGYFISGYRDGGDSPRKQIELVPGAVEDALKTLERSEDTQERFRRVVNLVEGFESAFGLELLSTVHWVVNRESPMSMDDVISQTYNWSDRKRRFSRRQIDLAVDVLAGKGWITADSQSIRG